MFYSMHMKTCIIFYLLLFVNFSYTQEHLFNIDLEDKNQEVFDSYLANHGIHYYTFLKHQESVSAYKLEGDGSIMKKMVSADFSKKYSHFIGHSFKGNQAIIFLKNASGRKLMSITYDFQKNESFQFEFKLGSLEYFLQSYSIEDAFYIFTFDGSLNVIKFDAVGQQIKKKLNPVIEFNNSEIKKRTFDDYFGINYSDLVHKEFPKVNNDLPNNLKLTTRLNKIYIHNNRLIWTFDKFEDHTLIMQMDLPNFDLSTQIIPKPVLGEKVKVSNSYLYNENVAQIVAGKSRIKIQIKNLKDNLIVKEFTIKDESDLSVYNNSFQELEFSDEGIKTKDYDNIAKFMRKISRNNIGISVHPFKSGYGITFGSIENILNNAYGNSGNLGFGVVISPENSTLKINPNLYQNHYAYNTIMNKNSFTTDAKYEFIDHDGTKDIFRKIQSYKDNYGSMTAARVFMIDGKLIFGFNNLGIGEYRLMRF